MPKPAQTLPIAIPMMAPPDKVFDLCFGGVGDSDVGLDVFAGPASLQVSEAQKGSSVLVITLKLAVVDFVGVAAAEEELDKFRKSAKNPGSIPKVLAKPLQDSVCVPQYHSPPASPGIGTSPAEESQMCKLLSKLPSDSISRYTGRGTYQRIWCWGSWANSRVDQYNFLAS